MTAAARRTRKDVRDPALDRAELAWWNEHAELMASVWDYDDFLSREIRLGYLQQAREFLSGGAPAMVLEPGCGSGGIGRVIAGAKLGIVGFDWSTTMTDLARAGALAAGMQDHCTYMTGTLDACTRELEAVDGVLIHAFLHHLDGVELRESLGLLRERLRPGARVWIYEPCFHAAPTVGDHAPAEATRRHLELAEHVLKAAVGHLRERGLVDTTTYDALAELFRTAGENGWYLSPKEVPFDLDDFTGLLGEYFHVSDHYWSTIRMYGWILELHLVTDPELRRTVIRSLAPLLLEADRRLAADQGFVRSTLVAPDHGFHVWECIVPEAGEGRP